MAERTAVAGLNRDCPVSEAVISSDGMYRYVLSRRWAPGPVMAWIMLNPSTADARTDDPTIRRCCGFAKREGCGGIRVLNLYALRSPVPDALRDAVEVAGIDPAGPGNDMMITSLAEPYLQPPAAGECGLPGPCARHGSFACDDIAPPLPPVVAAWGANPVAAARVPRVLELLAGVPLACLGVTASGAPKHPLYVRADAPLIPWPGPSSPYRPREKAAL